jgi:subfamily B ATP-binding cassette protein MsbA
MVLLAVASGFSIGMISPFVNAIFNKTSIEIPSRFDMIGRINRYVVTPSPLETVKRLIAVILAVFFLKGVFAYLHRYLSIVVEQKVIRDIRNQIYRQLHNLSLSFFHAEKVGRLTSRVTHDVQLVKYSIANGLITILRESLLVLVYMVIVIWASWKLALISFGLVPLCMSVVVFLGKKLRKRSAKTQEKMAQVTSTLQETISGIKIVKAFAAEELEIDKFYRNTLDYLKTVIRFERIGVLGAPLTEFLGVIAASLILWYGGHQILVAKTLSPDRFFVFLAASLSLMHPLKCISGANSAIQHGIAAAERIFNILDEEPHITDAPDAIQTDGFTSSISLKDVGFEYESGCGVLAGVSFEIRKGETVALVGPSGAGKTTLVDLIMRFYEPVEGRIELDGVDIRKIKLQSLRRIMGNVTQETILFDDTIARNIAYGKEDASLDEIREAARLANAHQFIMNVPEGYEAKVGERGVRLSGGERQRIAIARSVLRNPQVLIFDEATASLDSESERLIQQAISRLMRGRTAIVIAHRLSTVRNADKIVVLDGGRVVEKGTHTELVGAHGLYKRLYDMQFRDEV